MMMSDVPSHFAPLATWQDFLTETESLLSKSGQSLPPADLAQLQQEAEQARRIAEIKAA